jgi:hypothetical protein
MANDAQNVRRPARPQFAVYPLAQVEPASNKLPPPAFVADAMCPKGLAGKGRDRVRAVADEAARGVGVHGQQEGDEEVVGVVERLERLLADLRVGRRVHEEHAEQHDVPGDAARLGVVDLDRGLWPDLRSFDIKEAVSLALSNTARLSYLT